MQVVAPFLAIYCVPLGGAHKESGVGYLVQGWDSFRATNHQIYGSVAYILVRATIKDTHYFLENQ